MIYFGIKVLLILSLSMQQCNLQKVSRNKNTNDINKYNNFEKPAFTRTDIPVNKAVLLYTPNVKMNCKTMENALKVQWLYQDIDGSFMIRTLADNGEVRSPEVYDLNLTRSGQNTLIIRNATMKVAGTYNCLVSYSTSDVKSYSSEVNVVTVGRLMGSVIAPLMYFDWSLIYTGRMVPFIKCSNGRTLRGIRKTSTFVHLVFNSCFLPENLPSYCDLIFQDHLKKWTRFKRYRIKFIESEMPKEGDSDTLRNDFTTVKMPKDVILNVNNTNNAEFVCEVLPPPHAIVWAFVDFEQKCFRFGNMRGPASQIKEAPVIHRITKKNEYSSQINLVDLGYSSAGQYRCIVIYYYQKIVQKTLTAEVVLVSRMSDYVEMNVLKEVESGKEVMLKFLIHYTGNLRPILLCVNKRFEPKEIRKEDFNYRVCFI